jgi:hypothetical protein
MLSLTHCKNLPTVLSVLYAVFCNDLYEVTVYIVQFLYGFLKTLTLCLHGLVQ